MNCYYISQFNRGVGKSLQPIYCSLGIYNKNDYSANNFRCLSNLKSSKMPIAQSYKILGVSADCSEDELRAAYLEKVKLFHPDQGNSSADSAKFITVQEAYNSAMDHRRSEDVFPTVTADKLNEKDEKDYDIRHTAPQHRRYLTFDGVGFGSPATRQRQFKQIRVARATESIYEHRKMKFGSDETAVVTKDKAHARKIKISNLIDRVVDDLVRESMQKGEFDNLPGQGKPLDYSEHNPMVDTTTHKLNKIMVNNGYKPEWIMLNKEIRDGMAFARENLAVARERLGPPPYLEEKEVQWLNHLRTFRESVGETNTKINKYNMIVPFMEKQMVHYNCDSNLERVLTNHKQFLPLGDLRFDEPLVKIDESIKWVDLWGTIKQVFKRR